MAAKKKKKPATKRPSSEQKKLKYFVCDNSYDEPDISEFDNQAAALEHINELIANEVHDAPPLDDDIILIVGTRIHLRFETTTTAIVQD